MGFSFGFTFDNTTFRMESIGWLVLSGVIGIIIGDLAWLEALQRLGAFRVLLIDTFKPFAATIFGHFILNESIHNIAYAGILMTALGVFIVSHEKNKMQNGNNNEGEDNRGKIKLEFNSTQNKEYSLASSHSLAEDRDIETSGLKEECTSNPHKKKEEKTKTNEKVRKDVVIRERKSSWFIRKGYILAVTNVLLDTYGSLLTKQYGANFTTWAINMIRFGSSGIIMILLSSCMHVYHTQRTLHSTNQWYQLPRESFKTWSLVSVGVLFVTFFCPALSNYALFKIAMALALTLTSITPLYALFLEWAVYGREKKPTLRGIFGASLAVGGVIILGISNTAARR
jgi:drug/metabolite transporter (DMT)-like permease